MKTTSPNEVTVFKSGDDDSFARATAIVKTMGVPYRVSDTYEGADPSWRVHWLVVKATDADVVGDALKNIPCEVIPAASMSDEDKRNSRSIATIQLTVLSVIVLLAIVFAIMRE